MCGRYTDTKRDKQFLVRMGIEQAEIDSVPRYNLSPTQQASVVISGENGPELRRVRWGLIPSWAKDENIGSSLINARGETVSTKPAFRSSFKKRGLARDGAKGSKALAEGMIRPVTSRNSAIQSSKFGQKCKTICHP